VADKEALKKDKKRSHPRAKKGEEGGEDCPFLALEGGKKSKRGGGNECKVESTEDQVGLRRKHIGSLSVPQRLTEYRKKSLAQHWVKRKVEYAGRVPS